MLKKYIESSTISNPDGTYCVFPPWMRNRAFILTEPEKRAYMKWLWMPAAVSALGLVLALLLFACIPFLSNDRFLAFVVAALLVPITQAFSRWMVASRFRQAEEVRVAKKPSLLDVSADQAASIHERTPWFFSIPLNNPRAGFWSMLILAALFIIPSALRFFLLGEIPNAHVMVMAAFFSLGALLFYRQAKAIKEQDSADK